MQGEFKKMAFIMFAGLGAATLMLGLTSSLLPPANQVSEIPVSVVEVKQNGKGLWSLPKDAISWKSGQSVPFLFRVKHLRTEQLPVTVVGEDNSGVLIRTDELNPSDLLVRRPETVRFGQAVAITTGVDDERLVRLTLQGGMAAAMAEDLDESMRFISPDYRDNLGFNSPLMRKLLERAYAEFDEPRIEVEEQMAVQVKGSQAVVQAQVRLTATYKGRRSYLLGNQNNPNNVLVVLDRSANGWKVSRVQGLRPLDFEEGFLKLLGAQVGLPLTEYERFEKQQFCMPCRQRMGERFGSKH
jgi:ketosteroid isomerase-like protein